MLKSLPVEQRWPIQDRGVIQLFAMNTPNGNKVGIALEELEVPYEAHVVHIGKGEQHSPEFASISPNHKIPVIIDPSGVGGRPMTIMESGAILWHLAEKTGRLLPRDPVARSECLQWLFFQVGHVGPMFGQFGHFHAFARESCPHPYPLERYRAETQRLLGVLNQRLEGRPFIMGAEYTVADIAIFPWVEALVGFYRTADLVSFPSFTHLSAWLEQCMARPASVRGRMVCAPSESRAP